jgi:hypothetical protein
MPTKGIEPGKMGDSALSPWLAEAALARVGQAL